MMNNTGAVAGGMRKARRGFTLVEAALATTIVGVGVSALMMTMAAGTRSNDAAQKLTQAVFLAQEVREWTLKLPFSDPDPYDVNNPPGPDGVDPQAYVDDLDDLMNVTFSPPRDGHGVPIGDMVGWAQRITLTWRDPDDVCFVVPAGASNLIHVDVTISYRGRPVHQAGWLVSRRD